MPTYEYECLRHGVFEARRSMSESSHPQSCPDCGAPAPRVVVTAAAFAGMPATQRQAHAINERSAHEPKLSSARHEAGCGCCSKGKQNRSTLTLPDGSKAFPRKRPWMISH